MGMYTELFISCRIKTSAPQNVIEVLKFLFGRDSNANEVDVLPNSVPDSLPDHELFKTARWQAIGRCASFYFVPESTSKIWQDGIDNGYFITSRSDLKNYDNEIEKFIDWVLPYVDEPSGQFFAYSRYEEDNEPKLYYAAGESDE